MPTYEYKCANDKCNHTWDIIQKMTDEAIKTCPKCKKEMAKRLISGGVGFSLKGTGWARDNYS